MGTSSFFGKSSFSRNNPLALLEKGICTWKDLEGPAREELVNQYAPKIRILATRLKAKLPPSVELGELISSGSLGLLEALESFDPAHGVKLTTFAESRIKGAMLDQLRKLDCCSRGMRRRIRLLEHATRELEQERGCAPTAHDLQTRTGLSAREVAEGLEAMQNQISLSLDALQEHLLPSDRNSIEHEPFHWVAQQDVIDKLASLIDELTPREQLTLSLYYVEELTMKETALVMEITEGRVSQLHAQAIAKIRALFGKRYGAAGSSEE
jgi:RNA polymerase sigma factor FliA